MFLEQQISILERFLKDHDWVMILKIIFHNFTVLLFDQINGALMSIRDFFQKSSQPQTFKWYCKRQQNDHFRRFYIDHESDDVNRFDLLFWMQSLYTSSDGGVAIITRPFSHPHFCADNQTHVSNVSPHVSSHSHTLGFGWWRHAGRITETWSSSLDTVWWKEMSIFL